MANGTLSRQTILQMLLPLNLSNRKWLADRLYESVKSEKEAKAEENNISPELMAKIEQARADFKAGRCLTFKTKEELNAWMDSL